MLLFVKKELFLTFSGHEFSYLIFFFNIWPSGLKKLAFEHVQNIVVKLKGKTVYIIRFYNPLSNLNSLKEIFILRKSAAAFSCTNMYFLVQTCIFSKEDTPNTLIQYPYIFAFKNHRVIKGFHHQDART